MEVTIAILITLLVTAPLLTFLHELGHALAGLSVGAPHVSVLLGSQAPSKNSVLTLNLPRMRITLASWMPLWIGFAQMDDESEITPRLRALVAFSGPFTSLVVVVILSIVAFLTRKDSSLLVRAIIQYAALNAFTTLIMTTIPMRYPAWMGAYAGHQSDMARAIQALKQEKS